MAMEKKALTGKKAVSTKSKGKVDTTKPAASKVVAARAAGNKPQG
jgi:hypothetical protein